MDFILQDLHVLYYTVQIVCIMTTLGHHYIPIVPQVGDVAHGPLFLSFFNPFLFLFGLFFFLGGGVAVMFCLFFKTS